MREIAQTLKLQKSPTTLWACLTWPGPTPTPNPTWASTQPPGIAAYPKRPGAAGEGCPCPAKAPVGCRPLPSGTQQGCLLLPTPLLGSRVLGVQPRASGVWGPRPDDCGKAAAVAAAATITSSTTRLDSTGVTRCSLPTAHYPTSMNAKL